jgi:cell division protein FtsB
LGFPAALGYSGEFMQSGPPEPKRRGWRWYFLLFLAAFALTQLSGLRTLAELTAKWRQERDIEQRIDTLLKENSRIEKTIHDLSPDGQAIEQIARQELGWAKAGEIVVKIPEKQ